MRKWLLILLSVVVVAAGGRGNRFYFTEKPSLMPMYRIHPDGTGLELVI